MLIKLAQLSLNFRSYLDLFKHQHHNFGLFVRLVTKNKRKVFNIVSVQHPFCSLLSFMLKWVLLLCMTGILSPSKLGRFSIETTYSQGRLATAVWCMCVTGVLLVVMLAISAFLVDVVVGLGT